MNPSQRSVPTTEELWMALNQGALRPAMEQAPDVARTARAFHWPLEFPDVMQRGGFDVVLGNPPWEVMQISDKEYFATRNPEIAELAGASRKKAIEKLEKQDPDSFKEFTKRKHEFEGLNEFCRSSDRFALTSRGKINTYSLFAELFSALQTRNGRSGIIVPTGIATDATTAPFFAHLVKKKILSSLVDFENSLPIFPSVHRSFKFCILVLGSNEPVARFAFFLTEPGQLAEPERNFTLSPEQIAAINPNTLTAPVFRSRADAELTAKIYQNAPVLIEESKGDDGNPWGIQFRQGLFNMTSDSHLFRTAPQLEEAGFVRSGTDWESGSERWVPLYEAKMIHQFDNRWAGYAENGIDIADLSHLKKVDPDFETTPRYWVNKNNISDRFEDKNWEMKSILAWRSNARNTDERTMITTVLPESNGAGHSLFLLKTNASSKLRVGLFGCFNSLPLDYVVRQKVSGINLSFFLINQFPILPPTYYTPPRLDFITPRVLELTYTSHTLAPFARDLGYDGPPFPWDENRRAELRAELDAFYARAYGLTRDELRYILDPADLKGPDYPSETFRVLKQKETRLYGEYRTQRLVLAAWDRMESGGAFTAMEM